MTLKRVILTVLGMAMLPSAFAKEIPIYEWAKRFHEQPYQVNNELSLANNVLHAAGMTMISDAQLAKPAKMEGQSSSNIILESAGVAFDAVADVAEIGSWAAGGMSLLSIMTREYKAPPSFTTNHIFSWTDRTRNEISVEIGKSIQQSIGSNEPLFLNNKNALDYIKTKGIPRDALWKMSGVYFENNACDKDPIQKYGQINCILAAFDKPQSSGNAEETNDYGLVALPFGVETIAPAFTTKSGQQTNYVHMPFQTVSSKKALKFDLDQLSIILEASKTFPPDTYIYLAPQKYTFTDKNGKVMEGGTPLVIHEGKIHLFAKGV